MANVVAVFAAAGYSVATLQSNLTTLNSSKAITLVVDGGVNQAEQGASAWAVTNGVPFVPLDPVLDAIGCSAVMKGLFQISLSNPDRVLLAGASARVTAASGVAVALGIAITAI